MQHGELLDTYYDLYDIFADMDILVSALKELTGTDKTKSSIKQNLEYTRLWNIRDELDCLYDMRMDDLVAFRVQCCLRYKRHGYQMSIYDILGEC